MGRQSRFKALPIEAETWKARRGERDLQAPTINTAGHAAGDPPGGHREGTETVVESKDVHAPSPTRDASASSADLAPSTDAAQEKVNPLTLSSSFDTAC